MINDYIEIAERIESLLRRTNTFGKDKLELMVELEFIAKDLRSQADRVADEFAAQAEQCEIA